MNKRIRKKHVKQSWMQLQEKMRDPAFWQRTNRCSLGWSGYVAASHQDENIRVMDDVQLHAFPFVQDITPCKGSHLTFSCFAKHFNVDTYICL